MRVCACKGRESGSRSACVGKGVPRGGTSQPGSGTLDLGCGRCYGRCCGLALAAQVRVDGAGVRLVDGCVVVERAAGSVESIRKDGSATNILANRMLAEVAEFVAFSAECADEFRLELAGVLGSLFSPPGVAQRELLHVPAHVCHLDYGCPCLGPARVGAVTGLVGPIRDGKPHVRWLHLQRELAVTRTNV